jgi:hypothetical protein
VDFSVITSKIELIKITATEGMTLTNGEVFSKEIYLGKNDKAENWVEITDAEAEERQKALMPDDVGV